MPRSPEDGTRDADLGFGGEARRIVRLTVIGEIDRRITDLVANGPNLFEGSSVDREYLGEPQPVDARACWSVVVAIGSIHEIRTGAPVHRDDRDPPPADRCGARPRDLRLIAAEAGMQEASLLHFLQRRKHAGRAEVESMVVRERQGPKPYRPEGVENDRIAAAEERTFERPPAVTPKDRSLEVGE